jgi:hypothetical protein
MASASETFLAVRPTTIASSDSYSVLEEAVQAGMVDDVGQGSARAVEGFLCFSLVHTLFHGIYILLGKGDL